MNKLLGAVMAGALCSAVYGSIESANIVGYAPAELQAAGLTAGACFIPVTGKTFDLSTLSVVGYDKEDGCDGAVQLQTLNEFGQTVRTFLWKDFEFEGITFYGWYDADTDDELEAGEVEFQAGEGLWTYCDDDGLSLQSAGQVPTADISVMLQAAGLSVANPTPLTVDLIDCVVTGYDKEDGCDGGVQLQTLNEFGQTVRTFLWKDFEFEGITFFGWYDADTDDELEAEEVEVGPGQGLWTYSDDDGFNFVWPKVAL